MKLWILLDDEPYGGYFAAQDWAPNMAHERSTIREVRLVEDFPDDVWNWFMNEGGTLPLDDDGSNDSTWRAWWADGVPVWSRT
jgi:hypothetical protein